MSTQLIDDLEQAMCGAMLERMPKDPTGEMASMAVSELLIEYGNWRARLIAPRPRAAHVSRELAASMMTTEHATAIAAIIAKIQAGDDLTPHLSKAVERIGRD